MWDKGLMGYSDKLTEQTWTEGARRESVKSGRWCGVRPKKNLGQHFLHDQGTAQRIADTVDVCPTLPVLELGPGMGMLTQFLIDKDRPLCVVEIDGESVAYLRRRFPELRILAKDFLRLDLSEVFDGQPFVLTGNYPYDISSQIFFHMLEARDLVPCCTGMIQREVALRLTSAPRTKAYGILSVLIGAWYDVDYLFTVDEDVFTPPPRVKSAVVCLRRNKRESLGCDEGLFRRVVRTTFNQRRKMLRVSLRQLFTKENMPSKEFFDGEGMTRRPEELSVDDFITLTNRISKLLWFQQNNN